MLSRILTWSFYLWWELGGRGAHNNVVEWKCINVCFFLGNTYAVLFRILLMVRLDSWYRVFVLDLICGIG